MIKSYKIGYESVDMRIDRWIRNNIIEIPQSLIEKNLRIGKIKLNKKKVKSSTKLKLNDEIIFFNLNFSKNILKEKIKFIPSKQIINKSENLIIDNNENFIVINKESGISVQSGTKSKKNLIDIFSKSKVFENIKPFTVHRLDKETSGVMLIAKNRETAKLLTTLFRLRKIHKTYLALSEGEIDKKSGELNHNLIRKDGKRKIIEKAQTFFNVIDKNLNCSLVELKPITGRKHQIRKQLYAIGHPIYGDKKYNLFRSKKYLNKKLMLHSYKIKFMINGKKYNYKSILPDYFKKLIKSKNLKFLDNK